MRILLQDLRFGLRMLVKSPRFTGLAVLMLGLGIGITTAVFSFLDRALFRPLPVQRPHELVALGYRSEGSSSVRPTVVSITRSTSTIAMNPGCFRGFWPTRASPWS